MGVPWIVAICCLAMVESQIMQLGTLKSSGGSTTYTVEQTVEGTGLWENSAGEIIWAGMTDGHFPGHLNWLGTYDPVVAKLDPTLNSFLWSGANPTTRQEHSDERDTPRGCVVVNGTDEIILVGETKGNLFLQTNLGNTDAWIIKYDTAGTTLFSRQFGTAESDIAHGVTVSGAGNIFVSGLTVGVLAAGATNQGSADVFVQKMSSDGTVVFTAQYGGVGYDVGKFIQVNSVEEIFVAGDTGEAFGGTYQSGPSGFDIFLFKLTNSNPPAMSWNKQHGSSAGGSNIKNMQLLGDDIYLCGQTRGELDGNRNAGSFDYFVMKYDSAGNKKWTEQRGTTAMDVVDGLHVTSGGLIYLAGSTQGRLDGILPAGEAPAYSLDAFLVKLQDGGGSEKPSWVSTQLFGTAKTDYGRAVIETASGDVYLAGDTQGLLDPDLTDWDPGYGDGFVLLASTTTSTTTVTQSSSTFSSLTTSSSMTRTRTTSTSSSGTSTTSSSWTSTTSASGTSTTSASGTSSTSSETSTKSTSLTTTTQKTTIQTTQTTLDGNAGNTGNGEVTVTQSFTSTSSTSTVPTHVEVANVTFTIQGLSYEQLIADETLLNNFEAKMRETILAAALRAGRNPQEIQIVLSSGSVIVEAIMVAQVNDGETAAGAAEALVGAMNQEGAALQQEVVTQVVQIEGIASVSQVPLSQLSVSAPTVAVTVVATTTVTQSTRTSTMTTTGSGEVTAEVTAEVDEVADGGITAPVAIAIGVSCLVLLGLGAGCLRYTCASQAPEDVKDPKEPEVEVYDHQPAEEYLEPIAEVADAEDPVVPLDEATNDPAIDEEESGWCPDDADLEIYIDSAGES